MMRAEISGGLAQLNFKPMLTTRKKLPIGKRVIIPPAADQANANIFRRYAIEEAHWIWPKSIPENETVHLLFRCKFHLPRATTLTIHASADQRYELLINDQLISRGPHRSDLYHWSFESHQVRLPAGRHTAEAIVSWLEPGLAPFAQVTWRGGFLLKAEGGGAHLLDTGLAPWRVRRLKGITFRPGIAHSFHVVGPGYNLVGPQLHGVAPADWLKPEALPKAWHLGANWYGNGSVRRDWALYPSPLPIPAGTRWQIGRVRAIARGPRAPLERFVNLPETESPTAHAIEKLIAHRTPWRIPPRTRLRAVIDLDNYYCGFPHLKLRGHGQVTLEWAESLFHEMTDYGKAHHKGQRDEVAGKFFHGFGDQFHHAGPARRYRPFWWRAGRYWLLSVETHDQPLVIEQLELEETRYPLERVDSFRSSQTAWDQVQPILWRGLQTGAHEIFTDSPYYEQMMYVGDTRVEALCQIICGGDNRLARRALELFDWSRWRTGFIAERYPSDPFQLSLTFSTLWVGMLHEFAWWCDDPAFVRARLAGARSLLEHFLPLLDPRGLLTRLPGWSFVDWVPSWERGIPPGERRDGSACVNLQFLLMLQALAALEASHGEPAMARRVRVLAARTSQAIVKAFWNESRGLFADDTTHTTWSEHAQVLSILANLLPAKRSRLVTGLLTTPDLARCSIYFSHYWFEAMRIARQAQAIVAKIDEWNQLPAQGFKTPPERLHDTRSDNHSWSSHPLFHLQATVTGVRPSSPGFKTVEIAPLPGPLDHIDSSVPHPQGLIKTKLHFVAGQCQGIIRLPIGLSGIFRWDGHSQPLRSGANSIKLGGK